MKKIVRIITCFILAGVPFACGNFGDLNKNPNSPDASADYNFQEAALGSVFRTSIPAIEGDDEQRVKSLMVDFYAQTMDGGGFDTRYYKMIDDWDNRMFRRVQNGVSNLNIVLRALGESNQDVVANAKAVAMIWRVWVAAVGVDWFGSIPFASYQGDVVDNPPYRSAEDIYTEFFSELDAANTILSSGNANPIFGNSKYDIIFGNDKEKWRKFANSLHLRLAMHLTEVNPTLATSEVQKAIAAGLMASASDNAKLPPKANGDWGQYYNYTMFQVSWGGPLNLTLSMEKLLTGIGGIDFPTSGITNKRGGTPLSAIHPTKVDPRGPVMFDPAYSTGDWKGIVDGLNPALHPEMTTANTSTNCAELGILFKDGVLYQTRPYDLFLYEETLFLQAEAVLKLNVSGDAKALYEAGVRASFATWGVPAQADAYLASTDKNLAGTSASFDDNTGAGNTQLEKIITQKYFALFPDMSYEAWNDKRRLNLPRTEVVYDRYTALWPAGSSTDVTDPSNYIRRIQYPQSEVLTNEAEYNKGVALLGGTDVVTTKVWWDKGSNYCTSAN